VGGIELAHPAEGVEGDIAAEEHAIELGESFGIIRNSCSRWQQYSPWPQPLTREGEGSKGWRAKWRRAQRTARPSPGSAGPIYARVTGNARAGEADVKVVDRGDWIL
jgi:hypothetical protein